MECRFCSFVTINGEKTIKCGRKDCDNWGHTITNDAKEDKQIEVKE